MGVLRAILGLAALMSGGSLVIPGKWLRGHFKHVNGSAGHDHLLCEVGSAAFGIPRGAPLAYEKRVGCMYTLAVVAGVTSERGEARSTNVMDMLPNHLETLSHTLSHQSRLYLSSGSIFKGKTCI